MSEVDSLVLSYLVTVSEKLAKQFSKKRPSTAPWTGPGLVDLIEFYRKHCKEEAPISIPTTATVVDAAQTNGVEKRGKKRKLNDIKDQITAVLPEMKKKKKKKNKIAQDAISTDSGISASPDVVEVIQDSDEKQETAETPVVDQTGSPDTEQTAKTDNTDETKVGGMVCAADPVELEESVMDVSNGTEHGEEKKKTKKSKLKKHQNFSFRRVKEEEVEIKNDELADNTFEAKGGADDYGFKANQILKHTKGKSFRHEKTKKKRGTYKGGIINMGVTSIKFDSD